MLTHAGPHPQVFFSGADTSRMSTLEQAHENWTVVGPDGVAHAAPDREKAYALKHRLGPKYQVVTGQSTALAYLVSASVTLEATMKGMKRSSTIHDPEQQLVAAPDAVQRLANGEVIVEWSSAQPRLNTDGDLGMGPCQWLHVWAHDQEKATRKARSLVRAREKQLLECYEPVIGVVSVRRLKAADDLPEMEPVVAPQPFT